MEQIILLKLGEIVLKGLNRRSFEKRLMKNVRNSLKHLGEFDMKIAQSTIYITPGQTFEINRALELLIPTSDRPLSSDIDALKKRYEERYPIYKSTCDIEIDGNGTITQVGDIIFGEWLKWKF